MPLTPRTCATSSSRLCACGRGTTRTRSTRSSTRWRRSSPGSTRRAPTYGPALYRPDPSAGQDRPRHLRRPDATPRPSRRSPSHRRRCRRRDPHPAAGPAHRGRGRCRGLQQVRPHHQRGTWAGRQDALGGEIALGEHGPGGTASASRRWSAPSSSSGSTSSVRSRTCGRSSASTVPAQVLPGEPAARPRRPRRRHRSSRQQLSAAGDAGVGQGGGRGFLEDEPRAARRSGTHTPPFEMGPSVRGLIADEGTIPLRAVPATTYPTSGTSTPVGSPTQSVEAPPAWPGPDLVELVGGNLLRSRCSNASASTPRRVPATPGKTTRRRCSERQGHRRRPPAGPSCCLQVEASA